MNFERLAPHHAEPLLKFELDNHAFFSQYITPRSHEFLTVEGILLHIGQSVEHMQNGSVRSYVLLNDSQIVARANIRNIVRNKHGEIGYRVAQKVSGKGFATLCVQYLLERATQIGLAHLNAFVMDNNPASERVLVKNGFELTRKMPNCYEHGNQPLNGLHYTRALVPDYP